MKVQIYLVLLSTILSCEEIRNNDVSNLNETKQSNFLKKDSIKNPVKLITEINRREAHKYGLSTMQIRSKIKEIIFRNEKELTLEELKNEQLILNNNFGEKITISVKSVIDTIYFE
jgi:hypothetical protein